MPQFIGNRVITHNNKIPVYEPDIIYTYPIYINSSGYYVVGDGVALFSEDGVSWDSYSISNSLFAVDGSVDKVVSIGYSGNRVIYSTNEAASWTAATYSGTIRQGAFQGCHYSSTQGKFLISGHDLSLTGFVKFSTDGVSFSNSSFSGGDPSLYKGPIHWSDDASKWACIDEFGNQASDTYYVYESTDGASFSVTATLSAGVYPTIVTGLVYGSSQSRWVLCSQISPYSGSDPDRLRKRVAYSSDLINWTVGLIPGNTDLYDITYSPTLGRYVAVGAGTIIYSNDGITWTSSSIVTGRTFRSVDWSDTLGEFVAISQNGWFTKSSDGITFGTESNITASSCFGIKWVG